MCLSKYLKIQTWDEICFEAAYLAMENGGVDRTFIDCRQHQLGQTADIPL